LSGLASYFFPVHLRFLVWQFARRDVLARYRGSLLGLGWSFLTPLLMLGVYTFVFREVFNARWPAAPHTGHTGDENLAFALQVYAGLIVFNLFAEVLGRAPRLVLDQPNLVKKVVFPLEILPWVSILAALFHLAVNCTVLVGAVVLATHQLPATVLALPLVVVAFVPLLLGCSWLLASLGVFLRDIGQLIGMLLTALMFLSPVFYPAQALPARWQPLLLLNPLSIPIEAIRQVVLEGVWPNWVDLGIYTVCALIVGWLGAHWFAATRKGFADVI
jgi:lipopolysaccharide transport system permease protein